jgi:hypothetical protein
VCFNEYFTIPKIEKQTINRSTKNSLGFIYSSLLASVSKLKEVKLKTKGMKQAMLKIYGVDWDTKLLMIKFKPILL